MNFGEKLRNLIEEKDITQKELASRLNIAPSTVSSYVQNTREPDFETLKSIARFFDVSTDYLLDFGTDNTATRQECELLRIFRCLSDEQREVCIEQCKVFLKLNNKNKEKAKSS
ncbi:MAG: helix-turn-helix domain-containing protein [Acutalibacteraceae bacterium]